MRKIFLLILCVAFLPVTAAEVKEKMKTEVQFPASLNAAKLNCTMTQQIDRLEVTYSVVNNGDGEIFVLDLIPHIIERKIEVALRPIHLYHLEGRTACLLQGIAPLPENRDVNVRIMPYGTRLVQKAKIERHFAIPIPLLEQGPYDPAVNATSDLQVEVDQLEIKVHFLPGGKVTSINKVERKAMNLKIPEQEIYNVSTPFMVGDTLPLTCKMHLKPVKLWKQGTGFNR